MSRLPSLKPREVVAALQNAGFIVKRQKGSHTILYGEQSDAIVVVPMHTKELKRGTLHSIISQSGMTEEDFSNYL